MSFLDKQGNDLINPFQANYDPLSPPFPFTIDGLAVGNYTFIVNANSFEGVPLYEFVKIEGVSEPIVNGGYINETCPGAMDGVIALKQVYPEDDRATVVWDDGGEGLFRDGLSAGSYTGEYYYPVDSHVCCTRSPEIVIGVNDCPEEYGFWNHDDGKTEYPPIIYASGFKNENGYLKARSYATWVYNLNGVIVNSDLILKLDYRKLNGFTSGLDPHLIINQYRNDEIRVPFTETGEVTLTYHVDSMFIHSIGVGVYTDDEIDNISVSRQSSLTRMSLSYDDEGIEAGDTVIKSACQGEMVFLADKLGISGGNSPFEYSWDLDGDGMFGDADSLFHPVVAEEVVENMYSLRIIDARGQEAMIQFHLNVKPSDPVLFSIPELGVSDTSRLSLLLCQEDSAISIIANHVDVEIDSMHFFNDNRELDPSKVPVGDHLILLRLNECTAFAILELTVTGPVNFELSEPGPLFKCDSVYDLLNLISGDSAGIWLVGDSTFITDHQIDLGEISLDTGGVRLIYGVGIGTCAMLDSVTLRVLEAPVPDLKDLDIVWSEASGLLNLDTLLTSRTTQGGTWSGGDHVSGDGHFDPSGLDDGEYPVIYTVGQGDCENSDTTYINIKTTTSVSFGEEYHLNLFPNPTDGHLTISWSNVVMERGAIAIYDIKGNVVFDREVTSGQQMVLKLDLESGLYIFELRESSGKVLGRERLVVID